MIDVATLKEQTNILDLASRDTTLRRVASTGGGEFAGGCPLCGGVDRFRLWVGRNRFYCRGCGTGGDVIAYLRHVHGLTFGEAVARLGGSRLPAGPNTPARQPTARPVPAVPTRPEPPRWQEAGKKIVELCHEYLMRDPKTLDYLHRRGLTDSTIKAFQIGYNDIPSRYGLKVPIGWTIPLMGVDGLFYGILVRRDMTEKERRYQEVSGSHHPLMGRLANKPALLVTEGALDCFLAWQEAGDLVDVASIGSSVGNPDPWAIRLLPYHQILLCLDLDEPGERGRRHWSRFANVLHVRLPMDRSKGKDVTDFVLSGGDLRGWLQPLLPGQEPPAADGHHRTQPETVPKCSPTVAGTGPYCTEQEPVRVATATVAVDRSKLQEMLDAGISRSEAVDMARLDLRGRLLALAERHGYPQVNLNRCEYTLPGKENWEKFVTFNPARTLAEAEAALKTLEVAA